MNEKDAKFSSKPDEAEMNATAAGRNFSWK